MSAALAMGHKPTEPRKAKVVMLRKNETVDVAARRILRECQQQIARNIRVIEATADPEGPHQLRIGLRRLRSALSVFKSVFPDAEPRRLRDEARWLAIEVGRLRDIEAVIADVVRPEAEQFASEPGFVGLITSLEADAVRRREVLRDTLRTERVQAFDVDLIRFIEIGTCQHGRARGIAVGTFADRALRKRWRQVVKRGAAIRTLTIEQRHELRKELKKLRYLTEFLAPLYPAGRVARFLKRLKKLQAVFGALNDARVAQAVLDERQRGGASEPAVVERAAGCVIGATRTRSMLDWRRARKHWAKLGRTRPFWK